MSEWISVKDRLPNPADNLSHNRGLYLTYVLARDFCALNDKSEKVYVPMIMRFSEKGWHITDVKVTHWMPIPEPPSEA